MKTVIKYAVLVVSLAASQAAFAKLNIVACEPEWAALAEALGGEKVKVSTATTALQDPHHIQARPSLIAKVRRADLVVCTGSQLEIGWLPLLLRQAGNNRIQAAQQGYFMATDFVTMLDVPTRVDRAEGDIHPGGNPHIQTDPRRIAQVAKALADRLATLDGANAEFYASRYQDFNQRWDAAIKRWAQQAAPLRGVTVVSRHLGWAYLYDWLGIHEIATLEPKPGVPPSASHLASVLALLRTQPAKIVITAAYQDPKAAQWLSDRAHIPAVILPFTVGGTDKAKDLFGLFDDTVAQLVGALK